MLTTLRVKIMALLICAVTIVLILATGVTALVMGAPPNQEMLVENVAQQVAVVVPLFEAAPDDQLLRVNATTNSNRLVGTVDAPSTEALRLALRRLGIREPVTVTYQPGRFKELVSIDLSNSRVVNIPIAPIAFPSSSWSALVGWMALVFVGMVLVAVNCARWVTRPLALLQNTVSAVNTDGVLPWIREEGPGEVRATAVAINRLSLNLRNAMESRMRLVAAAGHDFRTPMTRMRLRAEFMTSEQERDRWLSDIDELDRIADSAIGLVREEVNNAPGEPVELHALMATLVTEFKDMGYVVGGEPLIPMTVKAGRLALTRALRNLLFNAVTHASGATIRIGNDLHGGALYIEDRGPGIPAELLGRVFEPFFRVDFGRKQQVPGAGLGLAIAHEIIHRYGGTLVVANRQGGGLSQRIQLPCVAFDS